jgi:uncharacterized protein (TIGR00251 family)
VIEPAGGGVRLRIRVQPRASRTEVAGTYGDALRVRLTAAPVDGAANDMLVRFLADTLGVGRAAVRLVRGASSRTKVIEVAGIGAVEARRRLMP